MIAIENARLFNETKEALARQTATSEVLQVIASSPGDLKPVFEQMLAKAMRLCEAQRGFIYQGEQGAMRAVAEIGVPRAFAEYRRQNLHTGGAATPIDAMRATGSRRMCTTPATASPTAAAIPTRLPASISAARGRCCTSR